jgi:hypothetical protein
MITKVIARPRNQSMRRSRLPSAAYCHRWSIDVAPANPVPPIVLSKDSEDAFPAPLWLVTSDAKVELRRAIPFIRLVLSWPSE